MTSETDHDSLKAWLQVCAALEAGIDPACLDARRRGEHGQALADDLDFLVLGEDAPSDRPEPLAGRAPAGSPRRVQIEAVTSLLEKARTGFMQAWPRLQGEAWLACLDADGAWLLSQLVVAADGLRAAEHGPAVELLRRAVASADPAVTVAAVQAITALQAREAAVSVAERLLGGPGDLDRNGVEHVLACLEAVGDGRVVRPLEAVLAEHGPAFEEHHAWRLRRVIQSIRRAGRK